VATLLPCIIAFFPLAKNDTIFKGKSRPHLVTLLRTLPSSYWPEAPSFTIPSTLASSSIPLSTLPPFSLSGQILFLPKQPPHHTSFFFSFPCAFPLSLTDQRFFFLKKKLCVLKPPSKAGYLPSSLISCCVFSSQRGAFGFPPLFFPQNMGLPLLKENAAALSCQEC